MSGDRIGDVTHYIDRISVAVITLTDSIHVGDTIHILGRSTDLRQEVISMQIDYQPVEEAEAGQEIALKVDRRVRRRDKVFKLIDEG